MGNLPHHLFMYEKHTRPENGNDRNSPIVDCVNLYQRGGDCSISTHGQRADSFRLEGNYFWHGGSASCMNVLRPVAQVREDDSISNCLQRAVSQFATRAYDPELFPEGADFHFLLGSLRFPETEEEDYSGTAKLSQQKWEVHLAPVD